MGIQRYDNDAADLHFAGDPLPRGVHYDPITDKYVRTSSPLKTACYIVMGVLVFAILAMVTALVMIHA